MSKLRVALFGLGRAGQFHLQSLRSIPNVELACVVDVDSAKATSVAAEMGCDIAATVEAAVSRDDVDATIIATPTGEHFSQIKASLEAGKEVLTEKPLGQGLEEIEDCFELAKARGKILFVGFNRRFDPTFASLKRQVSEGAVGQLQMIKVTSRDSPLPSLDYLKTSHGIYHDCIVHDVDMLRFITGQDPVEVYSIGSNFVPEIREIDDLDNVLVSLRYGSGLLATIDVNRKATYGYDQRIEAFGTKGMIQAENRAPDSTMLANAGGMNRPPIEFSFPTRYRDAYRVELEAFCKAVHTRESPISYDDVRRSFVLCELAERSQKEGLPKLVNLE